MTRSTKLLIPAVAALAAVAAFWFMVISPKREEIAKLDRDIAAETSAAAQAEQQAASYEKAKANYRQNYAMIARLGKAVPADDDVRSLLIQLDAAAKRSKVAFRSISVAASGGAEAPATGKSEAGLAPPPGTVPVGTAGFSAMPFTFAFSGSFFRLSDFFRRLDDFVTVQNDNIDVTGRLLLLGSIAVTPEGTDGKLQAQVGAASYLVPPTEGVTGGATPTGPAAATDGAAATPADGAAPSVPTATITGVR